MSRIFVLAFIAIFLACNQNDAEKDDIEFPSGGVNYISPVTQIDSINYSLPLKDSFSSLAIKNTFDFFAAFDEPNLSIEGQDEPVFRFVLDGMGYKPLIINFRRQKIISKIAESGLIYQETDRDLLNEVESLHYRIVGRNLGFFFGKVSETEQRLFDSLTNSNPRLKDMHYFDLLRKKATVKGPSFRYKTIVQNINGKEYHNLIDSISHSGFWQMGHNQTMIRYAAMDGAGFYLEANTKQQYQFVQKDVETNDTTKFTRLCKYLLQVARLERQYKIDD